MNDKDSLPEVDQEAIDVMMKAKNPIEIAQDKIDKIISEIGILALKMQFVQNDLHRLSIHLDRQNPSRP